MNANQTNPSPGTAILSGTNSVTYGVTTQTLGNAPVLRGNVNLACDSISPATCSFNPAAVTVDSSSTLTVSNLSAVSSGLLKFSIEGTSAGQTSSLPITIALADFSLAAQQSSASVAPGQKATYALTLTPINGFNVPVNLSCSGAPQLASCSVSPVETTPDGADPVTVTITVTTTAASASLFRRRPFLSPPGARLLISSLWIPTLLVTLLVLTILLKCRRRACLALALVMTVAGLWVGCGRGGSRSGSSGGNPGTPAGTYSLTVTGTTGSGGSALQHSLQIHFEG